MALLYRQSLPAPGVVSSLPPPSGATLVFNYPSGFAGASSNFTLGGNGSNFAGSVMNVTTASIGMHQGGSVYYTAQQNITSFTTVFTMQPAAVAAGGSITGMFFCVQNSNFTYMPNTFGNWGVKACADANGEGYGAYAQNPQTDQTPITGSIGIKFDESQFNSNSYLGSTPSTGGLYMNGGPAMGNVGFTGFTGLAQGFIAADDMLPYGINLSTGNVLSANIVYDGTYLVMVLQDTVTLSLMRKMWPVNIPTCCGGNNAWVGFVGGTVPAETQSVLSWTFWLGYNTRLATPTISLPSGQYSTTQTVTISAQVGTTIYYTTNGTLPVTSSTQYTGAITVSANSVITAIAILAGYTDSLPAQASYQIGASINVINFPSGFTGTSLIALNGYASFSGSAIQLTDATAQSNGEVGTAWFVAPVNVQSFTCSFTLSVASANANGMCFVIQNQPPGSQDPGNQTAWTGTLLVSGGINCVGYSNPGLGYAGIMNSVAVKFDIYSGSTTGLYTNGATPGSGGTSMSPVSLTAHSPYNVVLTYSGTTLSLSITDASSNNYTTTFTIDIPGTVGGNTAYVGFTGSTGGLTAVQKITAWTYHN